MLTPIALEEDSLALRQILSEFEAADEELRRRKRDNGLSFYVPNFPQLRAHRSNAPTVALVAGNRTGKTTAGAIQLAAHLTQTYPSCVCHGEWFSTTRRFSRPIHAVVVATEFPIIERALEPRILQYLPKDQIAHLQRTPQGYLRRIRMTNGSTVDILTTEMDQMAFESADWDFAWIDEPSQKSKYYAIRRGLLDRGGFCTLTFTPLIEPWMKEDIIDAADDKFIQVIQASTYENVEDIHAGGILKKDLIQRYEAELPADVRRTRIYGEFFHLRGIVYEEYTPSIHEYAATPLYAYPDPVVCVLDPHDRLPHHVIWAVVDRQDRLYVDRELSFHGTLKELCKTILTMEAQAGYRLAMRLIDPNFGRSPHLVGGTGNVIQELGRKPFPLSFGEANDDKEGGRLRVKDYLHYDRNQPLGFPNLPRLYFHKTRCPLTIRSMRNYQYDEWRGAIRDDRDWKEKEKQKDTHGADVVRYLCMARPTFDGFYAARQQHHLIEAPY